MSRGNVLCGAALIAVTSIGGCQAEGSSPDLGTEVQPTTTAPRVGAYYFGSFSSGSHDEDIVAFGQQVYGSSTNPWWSGVRQFFPGGNREWGCTAWQAPNHQAFIQLKPTLGYYDQSQPQVLYQHIRQAKRFGLSHFSFYWFWENRWFDNPSLYPYDEYLNDGLESFLAVKASPGTYPDAGGFEFYLNLAGMPLDLRYVNHQPDPLHPSPMARLVGYFKHPSHMKIGGRPVVVIGDTSRTAIDNAQRLRLQSGGVLTPAEAKTNAELFIAALQAATYADPLLGVYPIVLTDPSYPDVANSEAHTCLHPGGIPWGGATSFAQFVEGIEAYLTRSKPMLPCVTSGFDERPREDVVWFLRNPNMPDPRLPPPSPTPPVNPALHDPLPARYFWESTSPDARLAHYEESLQRVKHWMDNPPVGASDPYGLRRILTIYAWNEWHEGGILEPAQRCTQIGVNLPGQTPQCPTGQSCCCLQEVTNESFLQKTKLHLGLTSTL